MAFFSIFTARRYASVVYAVIASVSLCVCVCVCVTLQYCINMAKRTSGFLTPKITAKFERGHLPCTGATNAGRVG